VGDELLGLAAPGPVADGDDGNLVLADELLDLAARVGGVALRPVRVDDRVFQQLAGLVERRELAPAAEARVDRQHLLAAQGRLMASTRCGGISFTSSLKLKYGSYSRPFPSGSVSMRKATMRPVSQVKARRGPRTSAESETISARMFRTPAITSSALRSHLSGS